MSKPSSSSDEELRFLVESVGVLISIEQAKQLNAFNDLLIKWSKHFNLVSVTTLNDSITRHVLDTLSIGPYIQRASNINSDVLCSDAYDLMDVGSGAGLPVLPLAIAFPNLNFVSVETNGKKVRFQRQVVLELGLKNVEVLNERIESIKLLANAVTSRAFAAPDRFLELTTKNCVEGGRGIIMLGQADRMPSSLPQPWQLEVLDRLVVPGEFGQRHVAICIRATLTP